MKLSELYSEYFANWISDGGMINRDKISLLGIRLLFDRFLTNQYITKAWMVSGHVLSGESDNSFTCIDSGYNSSVPMDSPGYIAANASFDCTMQADLNGETRRLTFVQR